MSGLRPVVGRDTSALPIEQLSKVLVSHPLPGERGYILTSQQIFLPVPMWEISCPYLSLAWPLSAVVPPDKRAANKREQKQKGEPEKMSSAVSS